MKKNFKLWTLALLFLGIITAGAFYLTRDNENQDEVGENVTTEGVSQTEEVSLTDATHIEVQPFFYEETKIYEMNDLMMKTHYFEGQFVNITSVDGKICLKASDDNENVIVQTDISSKVLENLSGRALTTNSMWVCGYDRELGSAFAIEFGFDGLEKKKVILEAYPGQMKDQFVVYDGSIQVNDSYIYMLANTGNWPSLLIYDYNGKLVRVHENARSFEVASDGMYYVWITSSVVFPYDGLFKYKTETGEEVFRNESLRESIIRFDVSKSKLYALGDGSIFEVNTDNGGITKHIEFGIDTSYFVDDYRIFDLSIDVNGAIYLIVDDSNSVAFENIKSTLYQYVKKEGKRQERETTVTLTVPYRSDFMVEAIKRYELKYPTEHIELDYAYKTYEAFMQNSKEYGEKLTLRILTGDVGDIVQTGGAGIDYSSVAQTDVLMNIEELLRESENSETLNWSVLEGLKIGQAIRALPVYYGFSQQELNEDLASQLELDRNFDDLTWSDVFELQALLESKVTDSHLFTYFTNAQSPEEILINSFLEQFLVVNMPDLMDIENKTVDLKQDWFKSLLMQLKAVYKKDNFILAHFDYDILDNLQGSLLSTYNSQSRKLGDGLAHYVKYNESRNSNMIPLIRGEVNPNRVGYSNAAYSIYANAINKDGAWQFLSFLLEEDMQTIAIKYGLPVNNHALENGLNYHIQSKKLDPEIAQKYINSMLENCNQIDYLYDYSYMKQDIQIPLVLYLRSQISLDEALTRAEESILIRMNE